MDSLMDENKLKSIIESEIDNALGFIETDTTDERQKALEYYLREPYGNEIEGKSQIVTGEVAEVVDGALPQLIRVFTSSDNVVEFQPVSDGDEPFAKQATEYCNWVFYKENDGFLILHNWFKDALLQKTGVVKAYWDDKKDVTKEKYENLSDDELLMLMQDQELEVISQETIENKIAELHLKIQFMDIEIIEVNLNDPAYLTNKVIQTIDNINWCYTFKLVLPTLQINNINPKRISLSIAERNQLFWILPFNKIQSFQIILLYLKFWD